MRAALPGRPNRPAAVPSRAASQAAVHDVARPSFGRDARGQRNAVAGPRARAPAGAARAQVAGTARSVRRTRAHRAAAPSGSGRSSQSRRSARRSAKPGTRSIGATTRTCNGAPIGRDRCSNLRHGVVHACAPRRNRRTQLDGERAAAPRQLDGDRIAALKRCEPAWQSVQSRCSLAASCSGSKRVLRTRLPRSCHPGLPQRQPAVLRQQFVAHARSSPRALARSRRTVQVNSSCTAAAGTLERRSGDAGVTRPIAAGRLLRHSEQHRSCSSSTTRARRTARPAPHRSLHAPAA